MADREKKTSLVEGLSPIQAAVLAVLLENPTHGYDIAKQINRRMGASWRVDPKHIYAVLDKLEKAGLVLRSQERTIDDPRHSRGVYYLTDAGEQTRRAWLITPPTVSILRTDIHTRLAFATKEEIPELLRALNERRVDLIEEIEENAQTETPGIAWLDTIMSLYRSAVDKRLKAEAEWIGEACLVLEAVAAEQRKR
jgi:DNA-binding PadR family transcriptional regulator